MLTPPPSAQQLAYIHLQDRIVSGALPGGTRLKPEPIAQQLGISRMPVREAIRQLNAEGYVTIMPNRGAVVTNRTPEDVIELFEMRAVLEGSRRALRPRSPPQMNLTILSRSTPAYSVWARTMSPGSNVTTSSMTSSVY